MAPRKWCIRANLVPINRALRNPNFNYRWYCSRGHCYLASIITSDKAVGKRQECVLCRNPSIRYMMIWLSNTLPGSRVICEPIFNWCRSPSNKIYYGFDLYLPKYQVLIEIDSNLSEMIDLGLKQYLLDKQVSNMVEAYRRNIKVVRIDKNLLTKLPTNQWSLQLSRSICNSTDCRPQYLTYDSRLYQKHISKFLLKATS